MDDEMIDRVAEAMVTAMAKLEPNNKNARSVAIAAIKAMRELPTELIAAGDIQIEFDGSFELAWHKTIDAVING